MTDREYQIANLRRIFDEASRAPCFKRNPKYPLARAVGAPRISYGDIMEENVVIRIDTTSVLQRTAFWDDAAAPVIANYDSIEALVDDGWRLD